MLFCQEGFFFPEHFHMGKIVERPALNNLSLPASFPEDFTNNNTVIIFSQHENSQARHKLILLNWDSSVTKPVTSWTTAKICL